MIAYSYVGMYCRHILAIVHFNSNLQREVKKKEDGVERVKVSYPKFKNGEATVRNARIVQNFDYVEEIFQMYLKASKDDLDDAASKLKRMVPAPMNSMLDKQPRGEAIEKMEKRRSMVVADIPPTIPGICYILLFPLSKNLKDFTFLPFSYCSYCFVPTSCQASLMSRCLLCNIIFCHHSTCSLCSPLQK
ncbi:uncharacterized protein LOC141890044 isoform X1 [Acropora palmata]|uniref:uncharacterized protein LOC141890044 isoform X1 n=1 Tax=Acropora palmata TaxID=6131 RepID=UPI003DA17B70